MGRVVRGMGAIGWEGVSDMAVACAGGIGRLGRSGDVDESADGRASDDVDAGTAQRRQNPWQGPQGSCDRGGPTKNSRIAEERAAHFFSNDTTRLGTKWRPRRR